MRSVVVMSCLLVALGALSAAPNQAMIDEVKAGRRQEAKASWWGFDKVESTAALQAAINSGVKKLIIDNVGAPWVVDPIKLVSDQEIVLEPGVEVVAKRGAFKGTNDSLFSINGIKNVTLSGYGATLRMWKVDYQGPDYQKAEWRHTLNIKSSDNIKIYGVTLADSGGDGIYLGVSKAGVPCSNVHIKDVVCTDHHRQGISVISAENLLIEQTVMRNTAGTPPQAGIDFEPNGANEKVVNCVMRDCVVENNAGGSCALYLPNLDGTSAPITVKLENCVFDGGPYAFSLTTSNGGDGGSPSGTVEVIGCTFRNASALGLGINNVPAERMKVRFEQCLFDNLAWQQAATRPIMMGARSGAADAVGGVEFIDCTLRDPLNRIPLGYRDYAGDVPLQGIGGTLLIDRDGQVEKVTLTKAVIDEWVPVRKLKNIPRLEPDQAKLVPVTASPAGFKPLPVRQRRAARYFVHARAGDQVTIKLQYDQVGRYAGKTMPVKVTDPAGKVVGQATVPFQSEGELTFTAPATATYLVEADPGQNYARPVASTHPLCLAPVKGVFPLYVYLGDLYFYVPAGTREFGVKVFGEGGESAKATVFDPSGKAVWSQDNIDAAQMYDTTRPAGAAGEVWRVKIEKPSGAAFEDYSVDLRGVPAILGMSPEGLMKQGE